MGEGGQSASNLASPLPQYPLRYPSLQVVRVTARPLTFGRPLLIATHVMDKPVSPGEVVHAVDVMDLPNIWLTSSKAA